MESPKAAADAEFTFGKTPIVGVARASVRFDAIGGGSNLKEVQIENERLKTTI